MAETKSPHHQLAVHRRVGSLELGAELALSAPWTVLFGPSGSGKSSLLRAMCGLLGRTGVRFVRGGEVLQDATTFVAPHLRGVRWAPQHASLFPHKSVRENLAFGAQGENLDPVIELFRLEPVLQRRPAALSGGEQQRVNLARAFAANGCRLMLLDEPFTGMDRRLRDELLPGMLEWLAARAIPAVSVTHDVDEAMQLGAEVILLQEGKMQSQGPAAFVLAAERQRQIAALTRL